MFTRLPLVVLFYGLAILATTTTAKPTTPPLILKEGYIPFAHPAIPSSLSARTWYRTVGDIHDPKARPVLVVHGGPGISHVYLRPTFDLFAAKTGRPVVYYDQFGGGNSTRYPGSRLNESFWVPQLFVDEMDNVLTHLGIEKYDLYGHSWGAMLGAKHTFLRQPKGLHKLVLASGPAVMNDWGVAARQLVSRLPLDVQKAILENDEKGTWDNPEYQAAMQVYSNNFLCRLNTWPEELVEVLSDPDDTVHATMVGSSELRILGNLRSTTLSC